MNKSAVVLIIISICCLIVLAIVSLKTGFHTTGQQHKQSAWTPDNQRALAGRLKGSGLNMQAIKEYERYTVTADMDKKQLANLSYTIGKMYMDEAQYEKALAWFYRVEIADPDTPLKADLGPKIINCLEHSGKYNAAEYSLSKRVALENAGNRKDSKVVAEIAGEKIYLEDLNNAIDILPAWMKNQFKGKPAKIEFLKKYVADELLYRKAIKLEYDKDPDIRIKLKQIEKDLMVSKVVEQDLKDKIKIEKDDLLNFFKAHKENYMQKEAVKLSLIKAGMKEIANKIIEKLENGKDFHELAREISLDNQTAKNAGRFNGWIRKGEDDLGIGNVHAISKVLFSAETGEVTPAVKAGAYYYIFKIEEKRPLTEPSFNEIEEHVKNDYFMKKLEISYQNLLDQVLRTSDVKLYPDAVSGVGSP